MGSADSHKLPHMKASFFSKLKEVLNVDVILVVNILCVKLMLA